MEIAGWISMLAVFCRATDCEPSESRAHARTQASLADQGNDILCEPSSRNLAATHSASRKGSWVHSSPSHLLPLTQKPKNIRVISVECVREALPLLGSRCHS